MVINKICDNLPHFDISTQLLNIPKNINLADPTFNKSGKIGVSIGASIFWELTCVGQIKLGNGMPFLQKSLLGWIVSGPVDVKDSKYIDTKSSCNLSLNKIEDQIERFWKLEECSNISDGFTADELYCENHFVSNIRRDADNRFVVTLPIKQSLNKLGDSKSNAIGRFLSLEKRLSKNRDLKTKYSEFIQEYHRLGHMTEIANIDSEKYTMAYYLPHHCVLKSESLTTKT